MTGDIERGLGCENLLGGSIRQENGFPFARTRDHLSPGIDYAAVAADFAASSLNGSGTSWTDSKPPTMIT